MNYLFLSQEPLEGFLSGTMTPHGVLTSGHGFVEKVPSITNKLLESFGSTKLYYRFLEPVEIEQGLTLIPFEAENTKMYYKTRYYIPPSMCSVHATYTKKDVESVCIHPNYIRDRQTIRGWQYGIKDVENDLALINLHTIHKPLHICSVAKDIPSEKTLLRVKIFQYPNGHPLQKSSEEYANFSTHTHQCMALGGSSGSALRDVVSGEIVGVHRAGIKGLHNAFVPVNEFVLKQVNERIFE